MGLDLTGLPIDNELLSKVDAPLGAYRESDLELAQFNDETLGTWMLCTGQSCAGTGYETLTGKANVPDRRGRVSRMKDHGASQDADGERSLGNNQDQATAKNGMGASSSSSSVENDNYNSLNYTLTGIATNGHSAMYPVIRGSGYNNAFGVNAMTISTSTTTTLSGDAETRMKNTCVNVYIKVDHT